MSTGRGTGRGGPTPRRMHHRIARGLGVALAIGLALWAVACGGERDERGLAPPDEVEVPFDPDETAEEKRQEQERLKAEEAQDEASGVESETREPRLAP